MRQLKDCKWFVDEDDNLYHYGVKMYAVNGFTVADVHSLRAELDLPEWTDEQAERFLEDNEDDISEWMTEPGFDKMAELFNKMEDGDA